MKETAVRFGSKKGQEAHPAAEKALRVKVRKGLLTLNIFIIIPIMKYRRLSSLSTAVSSIVSANILTSL